MPRLRVSLSNLLLLTAIIALTITVANLWNELRPLRAEVRGLRVETGQLVVDDPTKLQARSIETYNDWAWKWRVWVPAGQAVRMKALSSQIPTKRRFSPPQGGGLLIHAAPEGREVMLSARIEKKPSGEMRLAYSHDGEITQHVDLPAENTGWLFGKSIGSRGEGVGSRGETADPKGLLMLVRKLFYYSSPTGQVPPDPQPELTDGVLIWLETEDAKP